MGLLERWSLCEIEYRREGGALWRPVTEELKAHGRVGERARAFGALRLLCALGWPEAKASLTVEKVGDRLFLLKCKPACWRIFFCIVQAEKDKAFLLLHAVCKKARRRKDNDTNKASTRLADFEQGRAGRCDVAL